MKGCALFLWLIFTLLYLVNSYRVGTFPRFSDGEESSMVLISGLFKLEDYLNVNCSEPVCEGEMADIYCRGPIIAYAWFFNMQSTCPGTRLRFPPHVVKHNFRQISQPITQKNFELFCDRNFENAPYLKSARLQDYQIDPLFLRYINDMDIRILAAYLHKLWPVLGREFLPDVLKNEQFYPVIPVKNPFIVPGGRFQVYFYWDSYWILKGLLISGMHKTNKGILENFASIIRKQGFIPNSGNIELTRRTQPPLFAQMVNDYFNATNDWDFVESVLPLIEKEMDFWRRNRSIEVTKSGKQYKLYQFRTISNCPRPEYYLGDIFAATSQSHQPNESIWTSLASACESGLDFTARWFNNTVGRQSIITSSIVPVDLNVFLLQNLRLMNEWSKKSTLFTAAKDYKREAEELEESIKAVLFDEAKGVWFDYDLSTNSHRAHYFPSNIFPLVLQTPTAQDCDKVLNYLNEYKVFDFPGGVPASAFENSGEQWDFPNTWAPSVHLVVKSLQACPESHPAVARARQLSDRFIKVVRNGINKFDKVWEKYDVRYEDGTHGKGGEYIAQSGFGWTNGAVLDLIDMYYVNKTVPTPSKKLEDNLMLWAILPGLILFVALCGGLGWFVHRKLTRRPPTHGEGRRLLSFEGSAEA